MAGNRPAFFHRYCFAPFLLTSNVNKTKHLCITNRKKELNLKVDAGGTYLGNVDTYDYLGFCMDKKLNMTSHIDNLIKNIK